MQDRGPRDRAVSGRQTGTHRSSIPAARSRFVREGQSTQFKLAFAAEPGRDYEIQFTDLLPAHWQSAQTLPAGAEGTVEFTDEIVPGRAARYFRAVAK